MFDVYDGNKNALAWLQEDAIDWLGLMDHDTWNLEQWLKNPTKPSRNMYGGRN